MSWRRAFPLWLAVGVIAVGMQGAWAQAPASDAWGFDDASGDVRTTPQGGPAEAVPPFLDVRGLRVEEESETLLVLALQVGVHKEPSRTNPFYFLSATKISGTVTIGFTIDGNGAHVLVADLRGERYLDEPGAFFLDLKYAKLAGGSFVRVAPGPTGGVFLFFVEKAGLFGTDLRAGRAGPASGTSLRGLEVVVEAREGAYLLLPPPGVPDDYEELVHYQDRAPDAGPHAEPYVFRSGVANARLHLRWPETSSYSSSSISRDEPTTAYAPGRNQTFRFELANYASQRLLVNLTYDLLDGDAPAAGFHVRGPATVTAPPGGSALAFTLDAPEGPRPPLRLRVRAVAFGMGDVGLMETRLENGTVLDPTKNELRLFAAPPRPYWTQVCGVNEFCGGQGMLALGPAPPGTSADGLVDIRSGSGIRMVQPVAAPFALGKGQPVTWQVKLVSLHGDVEGVHVQSSVEYGYPSSRSSGDDITNAYLSVSGEATKTVTTGGTMFTFSATPDDSGGLVFARGQRLELEVRVRPPTLPVIGFSSYADLAIAASGTSIRLPLVELPPEERVDAIPSPFQVAVKGDREHFVNAGEARLFNLTVLNADASPQRLRLDVNASRAWDVQVLPGREFNLQPGQSVTVGVLAGPPAGAPEGERMFLHVNASAEGRAPYPVTLRLTSIADDMPDDRHAFAAASEDIAALHRPAKESPSLGFLALLGAGGVGLFRRRR